MYCGQCGKRVLDTMLFCPFCGAAIVIPDQAESQADPPDGTLPGNEASGAAAGQTLPKAEVSAASVHAQPASRATSREGDEVFPLPPDEEKKAGNSRNDDGLSEPDHAEERKRTLSLFDEIDGESDAPEEEEEGFAPLELGELPDEAPEFLPDRKPKAAPAPRSTFIPPAAGAGVRRSSKSFIPVRDVDPEDLFMNGTHPPQEEDDPYDAEDDATEEEERYAYEEPERGSFFQRHVRGMVGLFLLLVLLLLLFVWAVLPGGQRVLAKSNLAWNAEVYDSLGYEAYEAGDYQMAATYFERAFARDSGNYDYAHSAMVAYYEAEDDEASLSMLRKCIELEPDNVEPYTDLLTLFPDPASRPWEVQQLLRQGYERTGEPSLNVGNE